MGCCPDGVRRDAEPGHLDVPEPGSLPWEQDGRRAWPKPGWMRQEPQGLPARVLPEQWQQELPV